MNKVITFLCYVLLSSILIHNSVSQPQYYNYNTNGTNNSFPLGIAAGKNAQWLLRAGDLANPTPAPAGYITKFWFRVGDTYPINATYTTFELKLGQASITALPTGSYFTPMTTVFSRTSYLIVAAGGTWFEITLDTPFAFNPAEALIIEMGHCAGSGATGFPMCTTTLTGNRRNWSVGGCPFVYSSVSTSTLNCGVTIAPPVPNTGPDYLFYKFENNPTSSTILNCAVPGVGSSSPALGAGTPLTTGGQYDTCITGTGLTTGKVTTGWNCNLGTSSWTISMWLTIPSTSSGSAYYLFGDAGSTSFRCFHNGVALPDNLVLRGPITDVTVTGIGPAPTVVTFVYDSAAGNIKAYKNGVLAVTSTQTVNIPTGTGFHVGGYGTSTSFVGKLDEFRLYHRALTAAQVLSHYNANLFGCNDPLGISNTNTMIPKAYSLKQNYPNPFNPVTTISFGIPQAGYTKLVIYDMLGRIVNVLVNTDLNAGHYEATINAQNIASGTYFYTLNSGNYVETKKMVIIK